MASIVFINLLVNSIFSLAAGLVVVLFFIWLFRVETGPWKLFLLSLPFLKIVYDFLRGLPKNSILYTGLDPFTLPPKHHLLNIGGGFSYWGPTLNAHFSVKDLNGNVFATSVGDHLAIWLNGTFGHEVLVLSLGVAVTVASTLLISRLVHTYKFEKKRRYDRRQREGLATESLGQRQVDIYISEAYSGSPFTGGVFKPYICIPADAYPRLEPEELRAVIAHEMGHIRQFDLVGTVFIQALGDIFWFIPGYRFLSRKIDRLREIVADQWAIRSGINPTLLASALVKLKEIPEPPDHFVLYSAFFREKSLLKTRVDRLLGNSSEKSPRFGWQNRWIRIFVSGWIFTAVMIATMGGNHSSIHLPNPDWLDRLLYVWGFQ